MSFPPNYPSQPPLVTFSTEMFHPLLTPLTTQTYASAQDGNAVDEERLPPGGFSLRHGFPQWIGNSQHAGYSDPDVPVYNILEYMRSAFNEESMLDSVPLASAANAGAYHAWHTYRAEQDASKQPSTTGPRRSGDGAARPRRPGEWNWQGVWEERVRKCVQASLSEPVLFGSANSGEEIVRPLFVSFSSYVACTHLLVDTLLRSGRGRNKACLRRHCQEDCHCIIGFNVPRAMAHAGLVLSIADNDQNDTLNFDITNLVFIKRSLFINPPFRHAHTMVRLNNSKKTLKLAGFVLIPVVILIAVLFAAIFCAEFVAVWWNRLVCRTRRLFTKTSADIESQCKDRPPASQDLLQAEESSAPTSGDHSLREPKFEDTVLIVAPKA